jgi:hypothetical protein
VNNEKGDLIADPHYILNSWKKYIPQLLNVHTVTDVGHIEIHAAVSVVPGPSPLEFEVAIAKLKNYKWPSSDQIPTELIQARDVIH